MNMCAPNTAFRQPCFQFSGTVPAGGMRLSAGKIRQGIPLPRRSRVQHYLIAIQAVNVPTDETSPPLLAWSINTGLKRAGALAALLANKEFTAQSGELITQSLTASCEVAEINLAGLDAATLQETEIDVVVKIYECWATGTPDCIDAPGCTSNRLG